MNPFLNELLAEKPDIHKVQSYITKLQEEIKEKLPDILVTVYYRFSKQLSNNPSMRERIVQNMNNMSTYLSHWRNIAEDDILSYTDALPYGVKIRKLIDEIFDFISEICSNKPLVLQMIELFLTICESIQLFSRKLNSECIDFENQIQCEKEVKPEHNSEIKIQCLQNQKLL